MSGSDTESQVPGGPGKPTGWAGEGARRWLAHADRLEATIAPVEELLLAAADLTPGAYVLDVGCGRGATTRAAALAIGPDGRADGLDIAPAMTEAAATAHVLADSAAVSWIAADAATYRFDQRYDRIVSRFGTLFFDDPVAAFANLLAAARPGGRLAVAVWQPRHASEFQSLAIDLAVRVAAARGCTLDPGAPDAGPFAYGRPDVMQATLEQAGWRNIGFEPHHLTLYLGGPGATAEHAVALTEVSPLAAMLADAPPEVRQAVFDEFLAELRRRHDGTGIPLDAAFAVVTASAGPPPD